MQLLKKAPGTLLFEGVPLNSRPRKKLGCWLRHATSPLGGESVFKLFGGNSGLSVAQMGKVAALLFFQPPTLHALCLEGLPLCTCSPEALWGLPWESQGPGLSPVEDGKPLSSTSARRWDDCSAEVEGLVLGCPEMHTGARGWRCLGLVRSEPFLPAPSLEFCSATTRLHFYKVMSSADNGFSVPGGAGVPDTGCGGGVPEG